MTRQASRSGFAGVCLAGTAALAAGCAGVTGGVMGAAVSGSVMGAAMAPENWPYEAETLRLESTCDGRQVAIEVSPIKAILLLNNQSLQLTRIYYVDQKLRYGHVGAPLASQDDTRITEKQSYPEFDWLLQLNGDQGLLEHPGIDLECPLKRLDCKDCKDTAGR